MACIKSFNIELLRVIATISVVLIHMTMWNFHDPSIMNGSKLAWIANNIYFTLTRFCVPIFFIISAYLVFNNKSHKNWPERLMRIGAPFLLWSLIYFLYDGGTDFFDFIKKLLTKTTSFHLWFLPAFIGYSLLLPAIKFLLSGEEKDKFKHIVILIFLSSIVLPSVVFFLNVFFGGYDFLLNLKQFNLTFPPLLIYALAYPYLHKKVNPIKCLFIYICIVSFNLALNVFISYKLLKPNEFFYGYSTILVFISSYIFFNAIMSIDFSFAPAFFRKLIILISQCSFGIYLSHWLIFLLLKEYDLLFFGSTTFSPVINTMIVFTTALFFVFLIRFIKPLRYFV